MRFSGVFSVPRENILNLSVVVWLQVTRHFSGCKHNQHVIRLAGRSPGSVLVGPIGCTTQKVQGPTPPSERVGWTFQTVQKVHERGTRCLGRLGLGIGTPQDTGYKVTIV